MRETTWISASRSTIEEIYKEFSSLKECGFVDISIDRVKKVNARVYAESNLYLDYLKKNFGHPILGDNIPVLTLYYGDSNKEVIEKYGYDFSKIHTPCVGLFDTSSNTAFIAGLDEYGLLKSTIVGMHSRILFEEGWLPIHGAALEYKGNGVVIVGHHGAGKSTALLNLYQITKNLSDVKILTDDWAVARENNSSIDLLSIEKNMSFDQKLVSENPGLELDELYRLNAVEGLDKTWIDINDAFGADAFVGKTKLDKMLIFSRAEEELVVKKLPINEAARLLTDCSYHMPDCGDGVYDLMIKTWGYLLRRIDCMQVSTRVKDKDKIMIYSELMEHLNNDIREY